MLVLKSTYYRIPSKNPLHYFVKWWYCDYVEKGKRVFKLKVFGKFQQMLAMWIYGCIEKDTTFLVQ